MMEQIEYEIARGRSKDLFNNALILPVAMAVVANVDVGSDLTAPDVQIWLGGRVASNQITEALRRIQSTGAAFELPYPGRPHPHRWERRKHPLWRFVADWNTTKAVK
jgi:hypothetical protein